jgi:hypothetical protein
LAEQLASAIAEMFELERQRLEVLKKSTAERDDRENRRMKVLEEELAVRKREVDARAKEAENSGRQLALLTQLLQQQSEMMMNFMSKASNNQ